MRVYELYRWDSGRPMPAVADPCQPWQSFTHALYHIARLIIAKTSYYNINEKCFYINRLFPDLKLLNI